MQVAAAAVPPFRAGARYGPLRVAVKLAVEVVVALATSAAHARTATSTMAMVIPPAVAHQRQQIAAQAAEEAAAEVPALVGQGSSSSDTQARSAVLEEQSHLLVATLTTRSLRPALTWHEVINGSLCFD